MAKPENPAAPHLGIACAAVAEAVFYHNNDTTQRLKLALALVDFAHAIQGAHAAERKRQS